MRISNNEYKDGVLFNGFDYDNQVWVIEGKYVRCGHPESMNCTCFGKAHEGENVTSTKAKRIAFKDLGITSTPWRKKIL